MPTLTDEQYKTRYGYTRDSIRGVFNRGFGGRSGTSLERMGWLATATLTPFVAGAVTRTPGPGIALAALISLTMSFYAYKGVSAARNLYVGATKPRKEVEVIPVFQWTRENPKMPLPVYKNGKAHRRGYGFIAATLLTAYAIGMLGNAGYKGISAAQEKLEQSAPRPN